MEDRQLGDILALALLPYFGVILFSLGLYSVTINVSDARRLNHKRAEELAKTGGWCYMVSGTALFIYRTLF